MAKAHQVIQSKQIPRYRLRPSLLLVPEKKNIHNYKQCNVSGIKQLTN